MSTTIYCRVTDKAVLTFYLLHEEKKYYLFTKKYRRSLKEYYVNGVTLNEALDRTKANYDTAILKTMENIPAQIKYLEKEFEIEVFERTKSRNVNAII